MNPFSAHTAEIRRLVAIWEPKLLALPAADLTTRFNSQHRTIKMILGHLCDSATLYFAHVADRVDESKLGNVRLNALAEPITLEEMIRDYGRQSNNLY